MAEKDVYQSEFTPARKFEGWEYVVECKNGKSLYFRDRSDLTSVLDRWTSMLLKGSVTLVAFTGCRGVAKIELKAEDGTIKPLPDYVDGGGAVLASEVLSIRYTGNLIARDAMDKAHAENLADKFDDDDDYEDEEEEDESEPAPKVSAAGAGQRKWEPKVVQMPTPGAAATGEQSET